MEEVEIGMKIKQSKEECEKILLANGFEEFFKTVTRDIYFAKPSVDLTQMSEYEIKSSCVRIRNFEGVQNLKLLSEDCQGQIKVSSLTELSDWIQKLKAAGFVEVIDTRKTDWIYRKGTEWHQLQDIKHVGLLDYCYDESIFGLSEDEQLDILKQKLINLGFELEHEEGVDKLRTLIHKEYKFSKNQNGKYEYQKGTNIQA